VGDIKAVVRLVAEIAWLFSREEIFEVCVQPVSATPLVVRLAFGSPRSFADVD
jgi:hypothetical protein